MAHIRLLIVDDVAQVRRDLCTVLALAGDAAGLHIEVVGEAENGQEAIRQAQALQPDVVLMDLEMPVLDGYGATQAIKARFPSIWVVALTVHGQDTDRTRAHQAGVDVFLEKGIAVSEILHALQSPKH
jgi:DNA-binding NarL/FixJ family response regulator